MAGLIIALALCAVAAIALEIVLARQQHPRRLLYAWVAWTPVAMLGVAAFNWHLVDPGEIFLRALMLGPFGYPLMRGFFWLRYDLGHAIAARQEAAIAADAERMRYRAMDFGGSAATPAAKAAASGAPPPPTDAPIAAPILSKRLEQATRERRSPWARPAEIALIVGVCAVGFALWVASLLGDLPSNRAASGEELVASTLEMNGQANPRVEPTGETCADGRSEGYRWSAFGSAGRACVDPEGLVSLWVERRW